MVTGLMWQMSDDGQTRDWEDASNYPSYFGPQGDVRYVYNYVLAVRNI